VIWHLVLFDQVKTPPSWMIKIFVILLISILYEMKDKLFLINDDVNAIIRVQNILRKLRISGAVLALPATDLLGLLDEVVHSLEYLYDSDLTLSTNPELLSVKGLEDSNDTLIDKNFKVTFKKPIIDKPTSAFFRRLRRGIIKFERSRSVETFRAVDDEMRNFEFLRNRELLRRQDIRTRISGMEDRWFDNQQVIQSLRDDIEIQNAEIRVLNRRTRKKIRALNALTHKDKVRQKALAIARNLLRK
jgi:hypothetical protein